MMVLGVGGGGGRENNLYPSIKINVIKCYQTYKKEVYRKGEEKYESVQYQ